ncbi:MAG: DCC1-like thiol-disulfide oxidoreductase family protein [Gammaproteobacteria bacterium]|nr:DCC1-like thiol-disulfide oxidoreductase family protein [Gammaproteobacteria bacterium]
MMREITPVPGYTGGQYSLFRILFGAYLAVHFGYLSLYAAELVSVSGMLPEGGHSPLLAIAPSLFRLSDAPLTVVLITVSGFLAAVAFAAGRFDRRSAAWMLLVLISLFARNPLIANPALPYVGLMLFAHLCLPPAPFGSLAARGRADPAGDWAMPCPVFAALVIVLCLSYSYSGYTKLLSPNWVSGDAVALVMQNPLARDWFLRDVLLALPEWVTTFITVFILYVELLFAPLFLFKSLRVWLWSAMLIVQFGFLFLLSFPDLTIPMLLFHLLLFDPRWLPRRPLKGATLHYDGECGVCHAAVRFALAETPRTAAALAFRPMQLDVADVENAGSWCLVDESGKRFEKTSAVVRLLEAAGGVWRLCATGLRLTPGFLRDGAYDVLARVRRHLAARPSGLCPVVSQELAGRFRMGLERE